jgi:tetratricopeptide (TPR) repeat protein/Mrp family chromosome partitioning ATPase
MTSVRIFLSTVSAEFRSYRNALRRDLERPNVSVKVQEDFIATGNETLDKLDDYIRRCDAVIHLVGDMTGALAQPPSLALICTRYPDLAERLPPLVDCLQPGAQALSYTQWEAWLALYHRKTLIIAVPTVDAKRDASYTLIEEQRSQQQHHLARLAAVERYPEINFASTDRLAVEMLRSKLQDILARAGALKKPVFLPYASINEQFKGRDAGLDDLSRSLGPVPNTSDAPAVVRVLSGLGGVGKTRLALEYAWRHAELYTARLFVGADSVEALHRNLAGFCQPRVLDLPEQQESNEGKQRDAVLRWLCQNPGWLMILDNVDTEEMAAAVEEQMAQLTGGHILVTSRLTNWSGSLTVIPVKVLSHEAAIEFLLARTYDKRRRQADDSDQAGILVEELDHLPLALEQAGAYIALRRHSLKSYLEEWRSQRDKVLAWYDPRLMQYPRSVAATWQTSFDQLEESARRLLQRLAWLSPAPIPESLLAVPVAGIEVETDPLAALVELESYSLVTRATDSPSFSMHRLVQEVSRRQLDDPDHLSLTETLRWINEAFVGATDDVRDWPILDPLAPHAQSITEQADAQAIIVPTSRLMHQLGSLYLAKSLYAEAEPLLRRALIIDETSFGANHPDVAIGLNNLALLLLDTNRSAEAEPLMRRALAIDETNFGADHPNVTRDLNNLAALLQATNRLTEAEALMRRTLAIAEANCKADDFDVATRLNNLAQLLQATNRLAEAEPLMRRALPIAEASFGPNHPKVATYINNLALLLQATNRLSETEPLMRRALAIDETCLGGDHLDVARDLNNLANLLQATNRLTEAELMMRRALAIAENNLGPNHPKIAICLNSLAHLLRTSNRLAEAEPLLWRALTIDEASFGTDHPSVAIRLNNLAVLLQTTNRLAEAEPLLRRALIIDEASFGPDHPAVARDLNNLAHLFQTTNRLAEAEPLLRRALIIDEASFGPDHPEVAKDLYNLVPLLRATNRQAEAEPLMRRTLAIDEARFGANHPDVAIGLNNLALLLLDTNRSAEAEPLMRRALIILIKSGDTERQHVPDVLNNYSDLLHKLGRTEGEIVEDLTDLFAIHNTAVIQQQNL